MRLGSIVTSGEALSPEAEALREKLAQGWLLNFDVHWQGPALGRHIVARNIARTIVEKLGITEEDINFLFRIAVELGQRDGDLPEMYVPNALAHKLLPLLELAKHGE